MGKKKARRFRKAKDAKEQLEEIEKAQEAVRRGKLRKQIDSIAKSKQRFKNALDEIRDADDATEEFE